MLDKFVIEDLSDKLRKNGNELKELARSYEYLTNTHKDLMNQIKQTTDAVDSFMGSHDFMDRMIMGTKELKNAHEEMLAAVEEQKQKIIEVNASMEQLSQTYHAPKEEIAKVIEKLQEYRAIQEEIKVLEKDGSDAAIYRQIELEEKLKKVQEGFKKGTALEMVMFEEMQNKNKELEKHIELQKESEKATIKVKNAQDKVSDSIDKSKQKLEGFKKSGLADIASGFLKAAKSFFTASWDKMLEVEQVSYDFGRNMGMSTQELGKHTSSLFKNYRGLASKLGMEFKDMYKFQVQYADVTEKATMLSMDQVGAMVALTRNTGEEAVNTASKNLDVFTTSADATIEYLAKGSARAALEGLNVKKYSEAFAKNIKMASKYTFKEGISGIQKMTLMSQRLKFNMESIGSAMDKFSTIEGAIEASAKIQVLGGSFAQNFANPLQAMSEALLDAEGFTKRIINTVSSQARFNAKTGEIDLSVVDKQRLKAYSEAMGISYDEVHNMATQTRKEKEISRHLNGDFTEEERAYLSNKAQFDKETGKWKIVGLDGKDVVSDISKLSKDKLNEIRQTDTHEKVLSKGVTDIKDFLVNNASEQLTKKEYKEGLKENLKMAGAEYLYGMPGWMKTIITSIIAIGGVVGLSNLGQMGAGLTRMGGRMLGRAGGGARASGTRFASGAKGGGIRTTVTKNGRIQYRDASGKFVKSSVAKNALKNAKVGNVAGKALGVAGIAYTVYDVASSVNEYDKSKKEIMASQNTTEEKATALNDAKKTRNSNIGGAVGGLAGGIAMGAAVGSVIPVFGTIIGGIVGGVIGSMAGSAIGEAVTEDVDETLDEIKEENGEKSESDAEEKEISKDSNDKLEIIKNSVLSIERYTSKLSVARIVGGYEPNYINSNVRGARNANSVINVSDIKVNVGGQIKLVGDNGINNTTIDGLLTNPEFKRSIVNIIKTEINKTTGGKSTTTTT